jgi:hypothetical protein
MDIHICLSICHLLDFWVVSTLVIMTNDAKWGICVQVFVFIYVFFISLRYMLQNGIIWLYGNSIFNFWGTTTLLKKWLYHFTYPSAINAGYFFHWLWPLEEFFLIGRARTHVPFYSWEYSDKVKYLISASHMVRWWSWNIYSLIPEIFMEY